MADITLLPSAKVPLVYEGDNTMTTQWYRFFWNVYGFTGDSSGAVPVSKGGTGLTSIGEHQLIIGNAAGVFEKTELIGSGITITYAPGTTTLAIGNSGVTPGTYGSASAVGQFTVDAKGTLVFAQNVAIAIDAAQIISGIIVSARISGSYTGITGVGTLTAGTWNATTIGTVYGGTGLTSFTSGGALYATSTSVLTSGTLPVTAGGTGQTSFTNGQLLIGNTTGNTLDKATLTAGTGISITNGAGAITITNSSPSLGGDVVGPASATDNAIARFDTTTGKLIQNSVVTIGDTGAATGFTTLSASSVSIGNTTDPGATNLSVAGTGKFGTTVGVGAATPAASGAGVTFPATQSASTDANTLDDYEEGTWTPVLSDGTNNATMAASTSGSYTKIGNTVFYRARVRLTSLGSVSGNIRVTGLPFTITNNNSNYGGGSTAGYGGSLNLVLGVSVSQIPVASTAYIGLYTWDSIGGSTAMQGSEFTASGDLYFGGQYYI